VAQTAPGRIKEDPFVVFRGNNMVSLLVWSWRDEGGGVRGGIGACAFDGWLHKEKQKFVNCAAESRVFAIKE